MSSTAISLIFLFLRFDRNTIEFELSSSDFNDVFICPAKLLLTGDCAPEAIPDSEDLSEYSHIQLPHHGKPSLAEKLFERIGQNNDMIYVVSDNTGNSNGGSDDLNTRGRNIKNTQNGDVDITTFSSSSYNTYTRRTLGL